MADSYEYSEVYGELEKRLTDFGISSRLEAALRSDRVVEAITKAQEKLMQSIKVYMENAPKSLTAKAKELADEFEDGFVLRMNIEGNFKKIMLEKYQWFAKRAENFDIWEIKHRLNTDSLVWMYMVVMCEEIVEGVAQSCVQAYVESLYEGYIPENMPSDLFQIIQKITGSNVLIPATAIFPNDEDDDSYEAGGEDYGDDYSAESGLHIL